MINEKKNTPIKNGKGVAQSNDEKIDQDFPGYPNLPATEEIIKQEDQKENTNAGLAGDAQENRKRESGTTHNPVKNEIQSDGSANAFHKTEQVADFSNDNQYTRKNK